MQGMWTNFETGDKTQVRINDTPTGPPYLSVSADMGYGVSFDGNADFARRVAETATEWPDAIEAYGAQQPEGEQ